MVSEINVVRRGPVNDVFCWKDAPCTMTFIDRNFGLACIDALLCIGHLPHVFDRTDQVDTTERIASLEAVVLTGELLSKITNLAPDGGDDVYLFADPDWGAENEQLYISRFDDLFLLPNLKSLWVHAVTTEGALDLSLLLDCHSLEEISANSYYIKPTDHYSEIVARLIARGVNVEID